MRSPYYELITFIRFHTGAAPNEVLYLNTDDANLNRPLFNSSFTSLNRPKSDQRKMVTRRTSAPVIKAGQFSNSDEEINNEEQVLEDILSSFDPITVRSRAESLRDPWTSLLAEGAGDTDPQNFDIQQGMRINFLSTRPIHSHSR